MIYASIPTQYLFKQEVQDLRELFQVCGCCEAGLDWVGVAVLDAERDIDSINMGRAALTLKEEVDSINETTDGMWNRLLTIYGGPLLTKLMHNHNPIICDTFGMFAWGIIDSDEYQSVAKKYMCTECEECGGCFACDTCQGCWSLVEVTSGL
jgi:hypothetical protein